MHSGLFYEDGRFWVTPSPIKDNRFFPTAYDELPATFTLWSRRKRLIESLDRVAPGDLYGRSTASVIPDGRTLPSSAACMFHARIFDAV